MRSRTSLLNKTVLIKNITRFAPLWGIYSVLMLIFLVLRWDNCDSGAEFANTASQIMAGMGIVNMLYAGLSGMLLFRDLYDPRMCNALHAMPLRRENWFATNLVSGLLFSLVPNFLGGLITAAMLGQYALYALSWFALMILQYLAFFGIAVFAAQCAGSRFGAITVYTLINFIKVLLTWLIQSIYEPFLYGISIDFDSLSWLCPVIKFSRVDYLETSYDKFTGTTVLERISAQPWIYAGAAALVGVALMVLALLIYRKRALENAGNLISLKPVIPVFRILWTLCVASLFYVFGSADTEYILLAIGSAVGFFTGQMLLEKKVQVFRGKNFLKYGLLVAVFAGTMGLTAWDPIGITEYVPQTEEIAAVRVYPQEAEYYGWTPERCCLLTQPRDVENIRKVHQYMLEERPATELSVNPVTIVYELKNGRTVERSYYVPPYSKAIEILSGIYSRPEYVLGEADLDKLMGKVITLQYRDYGSDGTALVFNGSVTDQPDARALVEALYKDCCEGTMDQWSWSFGSDSEGSVTLRVMENYEVSNIHIEISEANKNTLEWVRQLKRPVVDYFNSLE